jgi:aspartate/methionine/tyrosine aminotransferase
MSVSRLAHIARIGVEQMGDLADSLNDPAVLRLENLDTDLRPPQSALDYTKQAAAISGPDDGIQASVLEWQRRRDMLMEELHEFSAVPPHGGWSFLVDVSPLGLDGPEASKRLLERGQIAATPMVNWGTARSSNYVRIVFSKYGIALTPGLILLKGFTD